MFYNISPYRMKQIFLDFVDATVISKDLSGVSTTIYSSSIIILTNISGISEIKSDCGSVLVKANISGKAKITAYGDVIVIGKILGFADIKAQYGDIFLISKTSGILTAKTPIGRTISFK